MNLRLYHARILSMKEGTGVEEGEVWVTGNHIVYVGPEKEGAQACQAADGSPMMWDRELDLKGNLVMPGFKNAHTHSAMTFLRSYADDLPLLDWLHKQVFPMEAQLVPEDMYHLSVLAIMEYLTSGITANFDMYMAPINVAQASLDCGFRTVLCGAMNDFGQTLADEERWYRELNRADGMIGYVLGAHAEYTTSRALLEGLAELSHKLKAPVYLHNSETQDEVEQCIGRYGKTPTVFLNELGLYDYGGGGYHCVHMSEEDLSIFREKGLYAVTNPGSNTKLASGIAPISRMLELGIPVAVGTDGAASNNCLDMFREMFLVTGLAKLREQDAAAVDALEVLRMATVNGAHAMGLHQCDTLEEGKLADLIVMDLHQPNMQPLNHIAKNIVYSGSKQNVQLTMVNGKILYEKGTFYIGADPEEVYAKASAIVGRMRKGGEDR